MSVETVYSARDGRGRFLGTATASEWARYFGRDRQWVYERAAPSTRRKFGASVTFEPTGERRRVER